MRDDKLTTPASVYTPGERGATGTWAPFFEAIERVLASEADAIREGDREALARADRDKVVLARELAGAVFGVPTDVRLGARGDLLRIFGRAQQNRSRRVRSGKPE